MHRYRKYLFIIVILVLIISGCIVFLIQRIDNKCQDSQFTGVWTIEKFEGLAVQHYSPDELDTDVVLEDVVTDEISKYVGKKFIISSNTVLRVSPPSELGYYYSSAEDLFFGYKVPSEIHFEGEIYYEVLEHRKFDSEIRLMTDAAGNTYLDIDGYFYKVKKQD